ncbi:MAG: LysM peptidoglycan-binding domain-containing protein [Polyangiaceae bacterium]|nr:LysM peptidoglycan-binding domain-containing protein [Polyangiaceae bacterium]
MRKLGIGSAHGTLHLRNLRLQSVAIAFALVWAHTAVAQTPPATGGGASPGGTGGTSGGTGGGTAAPGGVVVVPVAPVYPNAPTAGPTGPVGGGNAQYSSSKPITGPNDRDGFDLGAKGGGGKTVYGGDTGAMFLGGMRMGGSPNANAHLVRRGDTLWDICDFYFQNPYQWPRIWSYNPQIQNPHWIYPGDVVRLKNGTDATPAARTGSLTDRRRQVSPSTVFLRNEGFIEDENDTVWGELDGSREDKTFLSDFDEVYIRIFSDRDIKVGQELTIFRPVKSVSSGKIVEIQGTVRVDQWNAKDKVARGRIVETIDTIERGARIGPLQRRYEVVPPVRNDKEVKMTVLAALSPHALYGQNQVVFVNAGSKAGLVPGNRLLVIKKGDGFHDSLPSRSAAVRIALESDSPAQVERVPQPNGATLPEETYAELRVIAVRDNTALCLVMDAKKEIEAGDPAIARKGY